MDYKEKYENGVECIQEILSGAADLIRISTLRKRLQPFFPELKENKDKDDMIRKEIIDFVKSRGGFKGDWLAWLEKYGKQNPVEWSEEDEKIKESIKKHIFNADDWYVSKVDGKIHNVKFIEKQGEEKPTDEIESKFKPGDWIIFNGLILHIDEVVNGYYRTTSRGDGIHNSYDWDIDNAARLWTIQEAKDGNVLVDEDNNIGIYVGKKDDFWHSCIYLGCDSCLRKIGGYHKCNNTKPATKEQHYLLFQKMKEEGYKWDADKKELKKIEQKPAESTKDYNDIDPHFGIPAEDLMSTDKAESKFKVGNWFVNNISKNVFLIKSIVNGYCTLEDIKGNIISACLPPCESDSHLWTIEDAKDGDILTANVQRGELGYDEYPFRYIPITFIYRKMNKDDYYVHSHCDMCFDGILKPSYRIFAKDFIKDICPATKEQHDLLFQKMKEEGYEWDDKKKEVKKIEPEFDGDDILLSLSLGNNQVQDILEDMGMLDENGQCPHTAEEIFKAGMKHAFNLNRGAVSSVKVK